MHAYQRRAGLPGPLQQWSPHQCTQRSEQPGDPDRNPEVPRSPASRIGGPVKRKTLVLGIAVLAIAIGTGVVVKSSAPHDTPAGQEPPVNTAKVVKGSLSAMVSEDGTLT